MSKDKIKENINKITNKASEVVFETKTSLSDLIPKTEITNVTPVNVIITVKKFIKLKVFGETLIEDNQTINPFWSPDLIMQEYRKGSTFRFDWSKNCKPIYADIREEQLPFFPEDYEQPKTIKQILIEYFIGIQAFIIKNWLILLLMGACVLLFFYKDKLSQSIKIFLNNRRNTPILPTKDKNEKVNITNTYIAEQVQKLNREIKEREKKILEHEKKMLKAKQEIELIEKRKK